MNTTSTTSSNSLLIIHGIQTSYVHRQIHVMRTDQNCSIAKFSARARPECRCLWPSGSLALATFSVTWGHTPWNIWQRAVDSVLPLILVTQPRRLAQKPSPRSANKFKNYLTQTSPHKIASHRANCTQISSLLMSSLPATCVYSKLSPCS